MQLIGQKNNLDLINKWNTLPNFMIIQGDRHTGKTNMVLYLCQKFGLTYVSVNKSVKDVRELISVMKPNSNILYHFKDFDGATLQAKNALLKVTEEPVPGNYIVITGGPQLKTLESRARKILMEPYTDTEIKEYMKPYFPDELEQNKLIVAGINTPAKINYYKKYEQIQQLIDYAYDIFSKITYMNPSIFIPMLSRFEDKYNYDKIDAASLFLQILINITEYNVKEKHYYSYNNVLNILLASKKSLEKDPTLKRKFLLFKTFYEIYMTEGNG